jgi:uncharacterized protein GlcG (DUF336 family)
VTSISLLQAEKVIDCIIAKTEELDTNPMAIAVLDDAGQLTAFSKQDGCSLMRADIAIGKAYACIGMGVSTTVLQERAANLPHFIDSLASVAHGKFIPVGGAYLIKLNTGETIGSVGVTGDKSDIDEACALAGVTDAGFYTDE